MDIGLDKLSYIDRKSLIAAINKNNSWKELAVTMQFLDCEMDKIISAANHAETLLDLWGGKYGHTVLELFVVLKNLKLYAAMHTLKTYIPTRYHKHIKVEEPVEVADAPQENQQAIAANAHLQPHRGGNNFRRNASVTGVVESAGSIPLVSYEELQACTGNWSAHTVLGHGGFATVFRGRWKHTVVAIKRIEAKRDNSGAHEEQLRQSISELQFLNAYRHENILPIYAYSIGGPYPCLVYQYMSGGSLDKRIHTKDAERLLTWSKRWEIATGAARGLQYLHTMRDRPLIHVDIKPANILLDEHDTPKIGDFGLARLGPDPTQEDVAVSRTFGTLPYLPLEFLTSRRLTPKLDVYSFGVLLFEMATGLPAVWDTPSAQAQSPSPTPPPHKPPRSRPHKTYLRDHVMRFAEKRDGSIMQLKDAKVPPGDNTIFYFLIVYGEKCVDAHAEKRPTMVTLLENMENRFTTS